MKKKKSVKIVLITFLVIILLIGGLIVGAYLTISKANENGNMLYGSWDYKDKTVLVMDYDKKTYKLNFDGTEEKGKVVKVEKVKEDLDASTINYKVTLDGNGKHVVTMNLNYSNDKENVVDFKSDKYNYKLIQIVEEDE